ncbi:MAG: hypothetical protein M3T96_08570 [Acidobacteriota bacterium]|nr:hypothetical protein [Acidobacteriota bacterium]
MRSKNILSIAAFTFAFGLSVVVAGLFISQTACPVAAVVTQTDSAYTKNSFCKSRRYSTAAKISAFIAADQANGDERYSKIYDIGENFPPDIDSISFTDYAEATKDYVDEASDMDTENLPANFQAAWREHQKAWRDYSNFLDKAANVSNPNPAMVENFMKADEKHSAEISRTFEIVLEIGESYGANVR